MSAPFDVLDVQAEAHTLALALDWATESYLETLAAVPAADLAAVSAAIRAALALVEAKLPGAKIEEAA